MSRIFGPSPANANVQVQRVYHYAGRRPFRAVMILGLGFVLGWSVCTHHYETVDRTMMVLPQLGPR